MRIARFSDGGKPRYGRVDGDRGREELVVLDADPLFGPAEPTGERLALAGAVRLLAPVIPSTKVICLGKNYEAHAKEVPNRGPASDVPILFLKPSSAVIGPDDEIVLPGYSGDVQLEAELAVVIGRECRDVSAADAERYIFGFTCANDVTARDLQRLEDQWFRAKSFDTSLPLGPWIETELTHSAATISSRINGEGIQCGNTRDMIHDVAHAVAMASEVGTLHPGDGIITGTPSGVTRLNPGDIVEVEIEGIGTLRNSVVER
jgi:2-keto-4-pentenoate hydratase/2-oxohepta-3-ene-1,7-dioic acid hydratase in catechol pathway